MDTFITTLGGKVTLAIIVLAVGAGALVVAPKIIKDPVIEAAEKYFARAHTDPNSYKNIQYTIIDKQERTAVIRAEFDTSQTCEVPVKNRVNNYSDNRLPFPKGFIELSENDVNGLVAMGLIKKYDRYSLDGGYSSHDAPNGTDWKRCYEMQNFEKRGDTWEFSGAPSNREWEGINSNRDKSVSVPMTQYFLFFPPKEQEKIGHKYIYPIATPLPTSSVPTPTPTEQQRTQLYLGNSEGIEPSPQDHIKGDSDADFVLIEYCGLGNQFCKKIYPEIEKLFLEYNGRFSWIFRQYPVSTVANEQQLAEAAECVNDVVGNNKFWQFISDLYNSAPVNLSSLPEMVGKIGVDKDEFKKCYESGKFKNQIIQAVKDKKDLISGTPTTFIYSAKTKKTIRIDGIKTYDELKGIFDQSVEVISKQ